MTKHTQFNPRTNPPSDMNYELVKELKDAGFPLTHHEGECKRNDCYEPQLCQSVPTLSELIAACGGNFYTLTLGLLSEWTAYGAHYNLEKVHGIGSTPEEAVARLWLVLNKKP